MGLLWGTQQEEREPEGLKMNKRLSAASQFSLLKTNCVLCKSCLFLENEESESAPRGSDCTSVPSYLQTGTDSWWKLEQVKLEQVKIACWLGCTKNRPLLNCAEWRVLGENSPVANFL